jgi:hypothetical protein
MLSRLACKSGDAAAAEQWLAPCDAASDDLEVDSPYRFSRAVIATARGDFQGVLATVGRVPDEVPLLDAVHSTCVVFRANALERLGDVAGAARALEQHTSHRPDHQTLVDKTFDAWASFNLCPQSRGQAQVVERKERADVAAQASGGPIGIIFAVIGTSMSVVGIGLLVTALVVGLHKGSPSSPGPSAGRHGKSVPPAVVAANGAAKTAAAFAVALPGGILTLTGLIFGAIGYPLSRAAARAKRIALNGERAQAVVQAVKPTGISINHVPQYAVTLLVQRAGAAPPYTATTKTLAARAVVGATVPVVLDPEDPKHVQLDLS